MLKLQFETSTAGYSNDSEVPEVTGYGKTVKVEIRGGKDNCVIEFDGKLYVPSQFEWILREINKYKNLAEIYDSMDN